MAAIDFVQSEDALLATDFTTCPRLSGTGVESVMTPDDVADAVARQWVDVAATLRSSRGDADPAY
jgi:hypothetical protein